MPIYEYKCKTCGKEMEVLQSNHNNYEDCSDIDRECDKHGKVFRMISSFATTSSGLQNNEFCNTECSSAHVHSGACGCHGGFCSN